MPTESGRRDFESLLELDSKAQPPVCIHRVLIHIAATRPRTEAGRSDGLWFQSFFDSEDGSCLEVARCRYEQAIESVGLTSEVTIQYGLEYAKQLLHANHGIEAEQLVVKLSADSRRVHGPEHSVSVLAYDFLEEYIRHVVSNKLFQALRYEHDGEICVITGPVTNPRQVKEERIRHLANNHIVPRVCCPVICHGLSEGSHLNGKLGEVSNSKNING